MAKTRSGAAALVAVAGLLAVAGCTSSSSPNQSQGDGTVTGTVTLWHLDDPRPEFLQAVKEGFEQKYPGTTVELTEVPEEGYVTKIDTAILAQQPPDVGFIYEPRWIKAGSVVALDDTIAEYDVNVDSFNKVAMSPCVVDGKYYCVGSLTGSVVLVYNKTLFDEAGIAYPPADRSLSIDEYADLARELHSALGKYGAATGAPYWWSARQTHFDDDGRTIAGYVDDAATLHAYDVLAKLIQDKVGPSPSESELVSPADMLGAGDVAMAVTDMEYAANTLEAAGFAWGAAPSPIEATGDDAYSFVGTDQYGAFANSANPVAARALVAYIANEGSRLRVEVGDQPPLDSTLFDQWAGENPGRQDVVTVMSLPSRPGIFVPGFWEVTAALEDIFGQMANGDADSSAITNEAPNLQDKLDREWETWEAIG